MDRQREMCVLIAGGGTGGHLFPAIAVAEEFTSRDGNTKITFIGTERGLESRIIPHTMWELVTMNVPSLKGRGLFAKIKAILMLPLALFQAWMIIRRLLPDMVIGVGGYSAGPATLVASILNVPSFAMEQNAIPGLTNRILGHFVRKVFATFDESAGYFSKKKVIVSGNPVRKKIRESITHRPIKREGFTILAFGGSQGAKAINEKMIESLPYLSDIREDIRIIHQVGRSAELEYFSAAYRARGFSAEVYHFIEDMGKMYSLADLVVCRAGSSSISELTTAGRPAVLVPFPYAADNHQEANARTLAEAGGAVIILERELTGEALAGEIRGFFDEPLKLASMSEAMKKMARPNAAAMIVDECLKYV